MAGNGERPENISAAEARERLEAGNRRFCTERLTHPRSDANRREEVASGQAPFATIITCSDSRVPPELVFDKGLGDLFVIRIAGNVVDKIGLGSAEFAAIHLGVNLIVVMGHGSCGAVQASVANLDTPIPETQSHLETLVDSIRPAVRNARAKGDEDLVERSIKENARLVADQLRRSEPVLAGLCWKGCEVLAAYYDLESGEVSWLE